MLKIFMFFILSGFLMLGCNRQNETVQADQNHEHENFITTVTRWTDDFEVHAEIAPIIVNDHVDARIHLTLLSENKPVADGHVSVIFHAREGEPTTFAAELSQPGVFIAHLEMTRPDEYDVDIVYTRNDVTTSFDIGHIPVYKDHAQLELSANASVEQLPHDEDEHAHVDENHAEPQSLPSEKNLITFLKEQQWKTEFATMQVQRRPIASSILAVSEVVPHQNGYAEVVAPVDGLLLVEHNQEMVVPGKHVKKGDQLLVLCPPIGASNTWLDRQLEYERAKRDFERAEKLLERDAISQREYEQIKQTFAIEKMNYETLLQNFSAGELETGSSCLLLRSPIDGVVADVSVLPGQKIDAGQRLLTVIDPSTVWIRAEIFEKDSDRLGEPAGLSVRVQGSNRLLQFDKNDFKLLSTGMMIDVESRTVPVIFQVRNPENQLKIGQVLQTEIFTTQSQEWPAVPASAVIDEEIEHIVFVQVDGEHFEKRSVQTGPTFGDWIGITHGLEPGERVVTTGAYAVKLASANVSVGSAHVH